MRILIAEDDEALAKFVRQGLEGEHYSVDVFVDGEQARSAATDHEYDLVILDLNLPKLDGVSVLRHLRLKKPSLPVLVLTQRTRVEDKVQCLDTGADDYVPKQMSAFSLEISHIRDDLIAKIHAAAQSRKPVIGESPKKTAQPYRAYGDTAGPVPALIALGASTGGPKALQEILPMLPRELSASILIVQHMPAGFTGPFAQRLNSLCSLEVREAAHNEPVLPGVVYIAPAGMQMTVRRRHRSEAFIHLTADRQDQLHAPSVNVLMKSVAEKFGDLAMGVILTGMGSDGAEGMNAIRKHGGLTIGQDAATCTVFGMPRACAELGALARMVPLFQIPAEILHATRYRKRA
jgi:two-component system, chemotaxis family, protein-glutamate methylesterase/glutaminase